MTVKESARFAWASELPEFSGASAQEITESLRRFIEDASPEQIRAWVNSIPWLQDESRRAVELDQRARSFSTILEYELPLEFRRPDVIVLENGVVVVVELKEKRAPSQADIDQVFAYARDLRAYHRECHDRPVYPVLVPSRSNEPPRDVDGVRILSPKDLAAELIRLAGLSIAAPLSKEQFLRGDAYAPLPSLVRAARELFRTGELRSIKRAQANTGPALARISEIAHEAARTKTRRLVLLSGAPGSGKTLVGLQLVHSDFLDDLAPLIDGRRATSPGIFLSGNMALVAVLNGALRGPNDGGRTFVRGVKEYVDTFARTAAAPPHNLLVFDEAQRAWDAERVAAKHANQTDHRGLSEPELFVEFAERVPEWCVVVALIGTGQEIHVGEEGGVGQWRRAVERSPRAAQWVVHTPPNLSDVFSGLRQPTSVERTLNLDVQLRFHTVRDLHALVATLIDVGDARLCLPLAGAVNTDGGRLFVTRNLPEAKAYVRERYQDFPEARFGIVASSRDKIAEADGISVPSVSRFDVAAWFNRDASDRRACGAFQIAASEFACQGLELDFAIVAWGNDFVRRNRAWSIDGGKRFQKRNVPKDPKRLRTNAYRVLLTRGRDGLIAYVPPRPELDETFVFLRDCGFRDLRDKV